jgi:hypothetical protein
MIVNEVFFGETGPVPIPKGTAAPMVTHDADAAKTQDEKDARTRNEKDARTRTSTPTLRRAKARVAAAHHRVSVANIDDATWVLQLDQAILGYIHRAGTVYVSLRGATLGLAVEVGQSVSRARAFSLLHSDWRVHTVNA